VALLFLLVRVIVDSLAGELQAFVVIVRKTVPGLTERALARFQKRAARAVQVAGKVNILVTGNREMRSLNRRFLGKDKPTDVLSFPPLPGPLDSLAGEIAISAEIAAANARRLGHSSAQEIKILVLHGLLHLAGYDHASDHGEMADKEAALRRALRLPAGLIERSGSPSSNTLRRTRSARARHSRKKPPSTAERSRPGPARTGTQ
jgi:probable rRNA maturation factor